MNDRPRVAIDARSAVFAHRTGVGVYTREMVRRLPRLDPAARYVAWYLDARGAASGRRFFADVPGITERRTPVPARVFDRAVARAGLPRIEWLVRFDVLFAPNFVPPPTRARRLVVTIHDLAFRLMPDTAPHAAPWWRRAVERGISTAERIIVPSSATRADVVGLYGVDPSRIDVVPLAVDHDRFRPPGDEEVAAARGELGLDARPYLLFLGLDRRKNLRAMLDAFSRLPFAGRPRLVIAGARPWEPDGGDRTGEALAGLAPDVRDHVVRLGYVDDRVLPGLLGGASALVYPSRYEGFGLPVLEAMATGTPVVASNVASVPELVGDAAILVDPDDASAIASALERVLDDDALRARLREAGIARAADFTWDATARSTAAVLHRSSVVEGVA
jgi:glycosyltransferase involved in cell wall biosynthesis